VTYGRAGSSPAFGTRILSKSEFELKSAKSVSYVIRSKAP
jgi:hypothetical protein